MSLSKTSSWQRDRAGRLHQAFAELERAMAYEAAPLVASLELLAARLDGTPLAGGRVNGGSKRSTQQERSDQFDRLLER